MLPSRYKPCTAALVFLSAALAVGPAWGHEGAGAFGGFAAGFMHPLLGWDHLAAMIAVGLWGAFLGGQGHAHGTELPVAASPLAYSAGFVLATGQLHLLGIGIGTFTCWPAGLFAVRMIGVAIAVVGIVFLAGAA